MAIGVHPARVPVVARSFDQPVAVIGDIHGAIRHLEALLRQLPADIPILFSGDLCDRGPDTRAVLDLLLSRRATGVRGNHDEWFDDWASGRGFDRFALSMAMGGEFTLASYGVEGRTAHAIESQRERVPLAHRQFIESLPVAMDLDVMGEQYWLVHAGVPLTESLRGVSRHDVVHHLARTHRAALLWPHTSPEDVLPLDRTIVMGHMPQRRPVDLGHVIALDTGCSTTRPNQLSAVILPERRFVTVG